MAESYFFMDYAYN